MSHTTATEVGTAAGVILVVLLFIYGMWHVARVWNYSWGYEDMVQETICEMVKPEFLKEPCDN